MPDQPEKDTPETESEVDPKLVQDLVGKAEQVGLPGAAAQEIIDDALAEGVPPEKLEEVVKDALLVEREDRDEVGETGR
jgi:hypothetical protein